MVTYGHLMLDRLALYGILDFRLHLIGSLPVDPQRLAQERRQPRSPRLSLTIGKGRGRLSETGDDLLHGP